MTAGEHFIECYYYPMTTMYLPKDAFEKACEDWIKDHNHNPPYSSWNSMRNVIAKSLKR